MQNQEVYGTWKILYKAEGKDMYHCKCIKCNVVEKDIRGWILREKPPVCECMNTGTANTDLAVQKEIEQKYVNEPDYKKLGARAHNLYGKTFGSWEVLYYVGDRKWRCRCTCGCNTISDIVGYTLEAGKSKGHNKSALIDETGNAKKDNPRYHQRKSILAAQNNIRLIHIYEFEYDKNRDKVRDWINYFLIYDKCTDINGSTVNITSIDIVNKFLLENNIEAATANGAYVCLGCTYNNELYAVVVVNKRTDGSYEIINYTSKIGYRTTSWFNSIINMLSSMSKKEVYCRCSLDKPLHAREIEQLGGKILKISDPTYVWVTNEGELSNGYTKSDLEILNKYPGMTYNTEDDIMRALRNNKLYKAGFILYTFIRGGK